MLKDTRFTICALVRSAQKAKLLESIGVRTVVTALEDVDILEREAASADAVIHTVCLPSGVHWV